MKFKINFNDEKNLAEIIYDVDGYSFMCRLNSVCDGMVRIRHYLELQFTFYDRKILCVEGLCAYTTWRMKEISPPHYNEGSLSIDSENVKEPTGDQPRQSIYDIEESQEWPVYINLETGWICIGEPKPKNKIQAVEFATDTIAVLDNGELKALWVKPKNLLSDFKERGIVIDE